MIPQGGVDPATNTGACEDDSEAAVSGGGALGLTRGLAGISLEVSNPTNWENVTCSFFYESQKIRVEQTKQLKIDLRSVPGARLRPRID